MMPEAPVAPRQTPGRLFRRVGFVIAAVAIAVAAAAGIGWQAWAIGAGAFLILALSKFPLYRPSRWRLLQGTSPWWSGPVFAVMLVLMSLVMSGLFHSVGLLLRALRGA
jgi:hypothetical protein